LRSPPRLYIAGSPAYDLGGVYRDSINRLVGYILNDRDLFCPDGTEDGYLRFQNQTLIGYRICEKYYQTLGKTYYWDILIHNSVPFLKDLSPLILAYAIYGGIPDTLLSPSITRVAETIHSYDRNTTIQMISADVIASLDSLGIPISDFIFELKYGNIENIINSLVLYACFGDTIPAVEAFR
jgi:hypothetical protein